MNKIVALGYVGIGAKDIGAWRSFATEVLGAALGEGTTAERLYLRIDERAWRVSIQEGDDTLVFSGWEVPNAAALDALAGDLEAAGIDFAYDAELAAERGVGGLIRAADPAGVPMEFFYGAFIPPNPFVSPTGARFVTRNGSPGDLGMGHIEMAYTDLEAAKTFFIDVLGFRVSDTVTPRETGNINYFLHVNERHHSLAMAQEEEVRFWHFMLQVEDIDMVGRALDAATDRGIQIMASTGRHINDHMVSCYLQTPSGWAVEYGFGGRLIDDDTWVTSTYDIGSFWGHKLPEDAS